MPKPNAVASSRAIRETREAELYAAAWATTGDCIVPSWFSGTQPRATVGGVRGLATRHVWRMRFGDPGAKLVLHKCNGGSGVHGCMNIRHLYLGTHSDNLRDAYRSGRKVIWKPGDANGNARFTETEVREIRRLRAEGMGRKALAQRFGPLATVNSIIDRRTWNHI